MSTLLEALNQEQLKAVTHTDGPLLIVAGAGTGKTTVITRRIAYLIEQKLAKPEEILALTFTDKAAGEMEERVDQILPLGNYDLWISTFHSFCQRLLEQHGLDIGLANSFKLLDQIQQWILVHKNFDKFKLDYYKPLGSPNKFIDALLDHFSKCKDEMITPAQYLEYAENLTLAAGSGEGLVDNDQLAETARAKEVAEAYHVYQKLLLDGEFLDFGDLINYAIELFENRPNILKYYQKKFKYILVDEFQDTNYAQYQLIKLLTAGGNNNLVVVGDDDQSIYKFRGASVSNILKLKEDYKDVTQITLVQNYRSSQAILDLAYNFIQGNNPDRLETKLNIDKRLKAANPEVAHKGVIEVLEGQDLSQELTMVVNKVIELKERGSKDGKAVSWNEFAILVRANSAADELLPRLNAAEIPYTFMANRGLFKKKLIADLISYFKLLDNYHESSSLFRVLQMPKFAISGAEMANLTQFSHKKTLSLFEALQQSRAVPGISETAATTIELLLKLIAEHTTATSEKTAVELFVIILSDLGILDQLEKDTLQNAEDRELLDQFYKKIESFEEQADDKSLRAFIETLDLEMQAGSVGPIKFDPNLGPESLKVMTVHSAKGLEFNYTFVLNLVDQRFPTRGKKDTIPIPEPLIKDILPEGDIHLQEERRLFYVAITRAKTHLYLSWSKDYGGSKAKRPSIFLQETGLVPSEKVATSTGKVVFTKKSRPGRKKQVFQNIPSQFSFSDIAMFETCPLEYKYRSYLKLPLPGTPYLSFGKTIHKVLQQLGQTYRASMLGHAVDLFGSAGETATGGAVNSAAQALPSFKQVEKWYAAVWLDEWYKTKEQKEQFRALGHTMLKQVYNDFKTSSPQVKYIEEAFSLPLGDYTIVGRLDRADTLPDHGLVIIDYKTGASPKTKTKRDVDQLKLYQWAAEEGFQNKVSRLAYWYLQDNLKIEHQPATKPELIELRETILATIERICDAIKYDKFAALHAKAKQHNCVHLL
jgi:DNA helicase II / ATP-dependent DNA helicase PcrA